MMLYVAGKKDLFGCGQLLFQRDLAGHGIKLQLSGWCL